MSDACFSRRWPPRPEAEGSEGPVRRENDRGGALQVRTRPSPPQVSGKVSRERPHPGSPTTSGRRSVGATVEVAASRPFGIELATAPGAPREPTILGSGDRVAGFGGLQRAQRVDGDLARSTTRGRSPGATRRRQQCQAAHVRTTNCGRAQRPRNLAFVSRSRRGPCDPRTSGRFPRTTAILRGASTQVNRRTSPRGDGVPARPSYNAATHSKERGLLEGVRRVLPLPRRSGRGLS